MYHGHDAATKSAFDCGGSTEEAELCIAAAVFEISTQNIAQRYYSYSEKMLEKKGNCEN